MALVDGLDIIPFTALYTNQVSDSDILVSTSTREGRTAIVLDFNDGAGLFCRDFETQYSWLIGTAGIVLYSWQPSIIEIPENTYNRATDWIECGGGNGFVQGVIIEADTFNQPKIFRLQDSDTLTYHLLNEVGNTGVAFSGQSVQAFSCATPFVAHSVRVVTIDSVPWRVWRTNLVFEPFPEQAEAWQTELTAAGGVGWQHLRQLNVEYQSTAPITITFTVDTGNGSIAPLPVTLPPSNGTQAKLVMPVTPNKWKLIALGATCQFPFFLFVEGMELKVRNWGSAGNYRTEKPFGGKTKMAALV
jgi:hypothetical protein